MTDEQRDRVAEMIAALREPFPADAIHWRAAKRFSTAQGEKCIALAYLDGRDVGDRFDDVFGPDGWYEEFTVAQGATPIVVCRIYVNLYGEDDRALWPHREDGAGLTQVEAEKGGLSAARKRAAALGWGVGYYLYSLGTTFALYNSQKKRIPDDEVLRLGRELPAWAKPGGRTKPTPDEAAQRQVQQAEHDTDTTPEQEARLAEIGEMADKALSGKAAKPMTVPQRKEVSRAIQMCAKAIQKIYGIQGHEFDMTKHLEAWLGVAAGSLPEHISQQQSGITDDQLRTARVQAAAYLTKVRERSNLATQA